MENKRTYGHKNYKYHLKNAYGLTLDAYKAILESQGGRCAICGEYPDKRPLSVDHDHHTMKIRGLLCTSCNFGLGYFKDNRAFVYDAFRYLNKHYDRGAELEWKRRNR